MTRLHVAVVFAVCGCLLGASRAQAAPSEVPPVLTPWIAWVEATLGDQTCPQTHEGAVCIWPSTLSLEADASGARFSLDAELTKKGFLRLPGSQTHWPQTVSSGKTAMAVIEQDGAPSVELPRGHHTLTGSFRWSALPDSLEIGPSVGLVRLQVNGETVVAPRREERGLLWLAQRGSAAEEERLDLSVHRRFDDGVPLRVTTRLRVSASGKTREVVLGGVLLDQAIAIELRSTLPAELTADGSLRLQVQPGEYQVEVVAILPLPVTELARPQSPPPWPEQELWVWQADDRLRHAELGGAAQVDPARTDIAEDWSHLPTYIVKRDTTLSVDTRRRGEAEPPPNQLSLQRSLWLDLDGRGYTIRDQIGGTMRRDFRLSLSEGELGRVVNQGVDQVITVQKEIPGVELRQREVNVEAEWRLPEARSQLPAAGYNEDVDSLHADLNLPPGFMLLGAEGVDRVEGTWIDGWNLFDFFFVLLVALAVGRVAGRGAGVIALLALVSTHHLPEAPTTSWATLLVFTALSRSIRSGRFRGVIQLGWGLSFVALLLVVVPFAVSEVRAALYPHLTNRTMHAVRGPFSWEEAPADKSMAPPAPEVAQDMASLEIAEEAAMEGEMSLGGRGRMQPKKLERKSASPSYGARVEVEPDPNSVVQTGPGLPDWRFARFDLQWSGPVASDQKLTLWLVPPILARLWSVAAVLLSALLLLVLVRAARSENRASPPSPPTPAATAATTLLLCLFFGSQAQAQDGSFPPPALLDELKERLTKPPDCAPNCLSVSQLKLALSQHELTLRAEVHAGARAAYRAPGPVSSWAPTSLRVDGEDSFAAARLEDGFLHILVGPGLHVVELTGPLPRSQSFTLSLGSTPHRVEAIHPGFVVEGLHDDGHAEGSLSIRREIALKQADETGSGVGHWLEVRREISLGVRFRVLTTVARLGPSGESVLVRIPLLPGEEPTDEKLAVEGSEALVALGRGQDERVFASILPPTSELKLKAPLPPNATGEHSHPFSEVWVVRPSPLYRTTFSGIAPVSHLNAEGVYEPLYRPWPTEQVTITAERLGAAKGASTTVDSASATYTPGARMERVDLAIRVRTSRGASQRIALPEGTVLSEVQVDGVQTPARLTGGTLELHLDPGTHQVNVSLQRSQEMGLRYQPMKLAVQTPLTNVTSAVAMPEGRWLLWTSGPPWGAAVLFWGYLVVALLAAVALGRIGLSPLKTHEWCLLSLGLTQVEAPAALIIVGWLFALALREKREIAAPKLFNAAQVGLVLWTLVALSCLGGAVHQGLVVQPDMQVRGMDSHNGLLRFYSDRTAGALPDVTVWSAPLWVYKALMLLWALWLAASVIRWLRWGFGAFRSGGSWRSAAPKPEPSPARANPRVPVEEADLVEASLRRGTKAPPADPER